MTSLHDPKAARRGATWRWHVLFWSVAVLTAAGVVAALHKTATAIHTDDIFWLGARYDIVDHGLSRIRDRDRDQKPKRMEVVYFGDSTVAMYQEGPPLPHHTKVALNRMRRLPWVNMSPAAAPGAGILQSAFLADHVATFEPDLVIWQLSFFQFTDRWTKRNGAPELVGFVHADRLPELITMPVQRFRLSLADILLHQAIVRLGLHDVHSWLRDGQLRFAHVIEVAEDALNPNQGRKPEDRAHTRRVFDSLRRLMDPEAKGRYSPHGERVHFGRVLDGLDHDDAKLRLLQWGIRALTEHGVDVLVYLNPTNLENLRRTGIYDEAGIQKTVDEIRSTVLGSGAHFLDLHQLLGDEGFRDAPGHFSEADDQAVSKRIANEIAEAAAPILVEREKTRRAANAAERASEPDGGGT